MNGRLPVAIFLLPAAVIGTVGTVLAEDSSEVCYVAVAAFRPAGSANADEAAAVSRAVAEAVSATSGFRVVEDPGCAHILAESYISPAFSIESNSKYQYESSLAADLIVIGRVCDLGDARSVVAKAANTGTHAHFMVRRVCATDEDRTETGRVVASDITAGVAERRAEMLRNLLPPEDRFASMSDSLRGPTAPRVALATIPWEKGASSNRMDLASASWAAAAEFLGKMGFTTVGPDDSPDWYVNAVIALDYVDHLKIGREARITVRVSARDAAKESFYDRFLFRRLRGQATEEEEAAAAARLTAHMILDLAPLLLEQRAQASVTAENDS